MECIVIEADVKKESDEPFCQHCIEEHAKRIAEMLGKQEQERAKSYPPPPPNETEVIKDRNVILEQHARLMEQQQKEQEVKQRKLEKDMEKMAGLLAQIMKV
jgi:hypothetical protein